MESNSQNIGNASAYCIELDDKTARCSLCESGSFFNESSNCEKCPLNCSKCNARGTCEECLTNFTW